MHTPSSGKPVRLLHCIPDMSGGGAERQLALLAKAQVGRGAEVHVALVRGGPNVARLETSGATLHWIDALGSHDPRTLSTLLSVIRQVSPSVIQTWLPQMDVLGGLAAVLVGLPWVLSERASEPAYIDRWKDRVLRRLVGRRASAIVANSTQGLAYWRSRAHPRAHITLVANAIPLTEIDAVGRGDLSALGIPDGRPVALFAGRLVPQKNLALLIAALTPVLNERDASAVICGDGPCRSWLEARLDVKGLKGRIHVVGYRADVWQLMKRATVFLNTSTFEGQPNTVLEAMASGCPIVASDIAEHRAFLDESCAAIVPLDAPAQWAAAIRDAFDGAELSRRRAERARRSVERFSVETAAEAYDDVYHKILTNERGFTRRVRNALLSGGPSR